MATRIVFMGSPDFALPTLQALNDHFNVVGVVTQPDRPSGRGQNIQPPEVKQLALRLNLPLIQPVTLKDSQVFRQLETWQPDVIVVAAFGQILNQAVLDLPPYGCVNVHASLLPRWRGAAPVQAAILQDDITGVTIMKMDAGLDTGPILSQREISIAPDTNAGKLTAELARMGADLLTRTLPGYLAGEIQPRPQSEQDATYAPRLTTADGQLDFSKSARFLARQVRAYDPWPGTYQFFNHNRVKVFRAHAVQTTEAVAGARAIVDGKPAWGTGEGWLVLDELQLAGKKKVSGEVFLHGARDWAMTKDKEQ